MNLSKYCADPGKAQNRHFGSSDNSETGNGPSPKRNRSKINRLFLWTAIAVAAVMIIAAFILVFPMLNKTAQHNTLIRIPAHATMQQMEDSIAKYLGAEYAADTRRAYTIVSDKTLGPRHGAFEIEAGMTPFRAARQLARGGQAGISVTVNGQRTAEDVAHLFASKYEFSEEDFLKALKDSRNFNKYNTDTDHALTLFLEDTYEFYWTVTPEEIIEAMNQNYKKFWNYNRIDSAESLHLLPREVVVLASIVDAETNMAGEKGTIGRLYINRLEKNMKLQSDPTVIYATGDFGITRVGGEMLRNPSPYNTYMHEGLPPGPIRVTSTATIDAILTSRPNNYLYMCADESLNGSHNFAVTFEEHKENVKRYTRELDRKGITLRPADDDPD